jgi:hypothetical protein
MQIDPLNTMPLQQFIMQVQSAENSRAKDVRIDITTAKNLAFTLGVVLARLQGDMEKFVKENSGSTNEEITINVGSSQADWQ